VIASEREIESMRHAPGTNENKLKFVLEKMMPKLGLDCNRVKDR
jgi:hypothetical protein